MNRRAMCWTVLMGGILFPATLAATQNVFNPDWSPDGQRIVFERQIGGEDLYHLYVVELASGTVERIGDRSFSETDATWSPDGTVLAYVSHERGASMISVMRADGSQPRRLSDGSRVDYSPSWSPDGAMIAFVSRASRSGGNHDVTVVRASGSGRRVVSDGVTNNQGPVWLPDGHLMIVARGEWPRFALYQLDITTHDARPMIPPADSSSDGHPAISPDGRKLAFKSNRDGNDEIYLYDFDTSKIVRVTENPGRDWMPAWSPDGSRLAIASERDGTWGIWVLTLNDGSAHRVDAGR